MTIFKSDAFLRPWLWPASLVYVRSEDELLLKRALCPEITENCYKLFGPQNDAMFASLLLMLAILEMIAMLAMPEAADPLRERSVLMLHALHAVSMLQAYCT